jgi:hypothetical protein
MVARMSCETKDVRARSGNLEAPAMNRVFNTAELVEHILLYLDPESILSTSSVRRRFQDVIDGCKALQCALFLRPAQASTVWDIDYGKVRHAKTALDLPHPFPRLLDEYPRILTQIVQGRQTCIPMEVNPILLDASRYQENFGYALYDMSGVILSPLYTRMELFPLHPDPKSRYDDMYINQPPCRRATLGWHDSFDSGNLTAVEGKDRIQWKHLREALKEWYRGLPLLKRNISSAQADCGCLEWTLRVHDSIFPTESVLKEVQASTMWHDPGWMYMVD